MPQKPWPPERIVRPSMWTSMSSQWLNAPAMSRAVAGSARSRLPSVWSENTTPQPNVSSGAVALEHAHRVAPGRAFLSEQRGVEAGGAAADAEDAHALGFAIAGGPLDRRAVRD